MNEEFAYDLKKVFFLNRRWLVITLLLTLTAAFSEHGMRGLSAVLSFFRGVMELGQGDGRSLSDLPLFPILTIYLILYSALLHLARESDDSQANVLLHFSGRRSWVASKIFSLAVYVLFSLFVVYLGLFFFSLLLPGRTVRCNMVMMIPQTEVIRYLFFTLPVCLFVLLTTGVAAYYLAGFAPALMLVFLIMILSFFQYSDWNPFTFFMLQRSSFVSGTGLDFTKSWLFLVPSAVIVAVLLGFAGRMEILREKKRY